MPITIQTRLGCSRSLVLIVLMVTVAVGAPGQVTLDGSLGRLTTLSGPNYMIGSNLGQVKGNNLFQSFSVFNIATGETATFLGPSNIQNIVGRNTNWLPSLKHP